MSVFTENEQVVATRPTLPRVNLLPPEIAVERRYRQLRGGAGGAIALAVVAIVLVYAANVGAEHAQQDQVNASKQQRAAAQQQVDSYANVDQTFKRAESRSQLRAQALQGKVLWSEYLNNLGLVTPKNVWLTAFSATPVSSSDAAGTTTTATGTTDSADTPFNPNTKTGGGTDTSGSTGAESQTGIATVTFSGVGLTYSDVATWLNQLNNQPNNIDAYTTSNTEQIIGSKKVVVFSGTVTVTTGALAPTTSGN